MKTVKLERSKIREIVAQSGCISECIVNLYTEVINTPWDDIESFNDWPKCNNTTWCFILDEMKKKWDPVSSGLMWMNKGFSSFHGELNDFEVFVPKDCVVLVGPKIIESSTVVDMTAGFAQQEVEELSSNFDENLHNE